MAKKPTDIQPTDERPEDITDNTPEDGLEELEAAEEAAAESTKSDEEKPDEEEEEKKLEYEADPRDDIEESISAKKQDEQPAEETPAEEDPEKPEAKAADPDDDNKDPIERVIIDGEPREMRRSEWQKQLAEYQKHGSADKRLAEASELLRQAKEISKAAPKPTEEKTEASDQDSTPDKDTSSDDLLAKIGEKLQFGDTQEVVEALKTVIDKAREGQSKATDQPPQQLDEQVVISAVRQAREQDLSEAALKKFDSDHPELSDNKRLQSIMRNEISDVMRTDIREALAERGRSQEEITQVDTLTEQEIVQAHRAMRANGIVRRDTDNVLRSAKDNLVKANLWPGASRSASSEERASRKQSAQQQPASRSRPATEQPSQKKSIGQTVADIVAEEQQARGNPAL